MNGYQEWLIIFVLYLVIKLKIDMSKTIIQSVQFKNCTCDILYNLYMDSKLHSKVIDGPVKIKKKEGTIFSAYGDYITGKTLQLISNKLIVQSWWGSDWDTRETISTLILLFEQKGKDAVVYMTHANVPDAHYQSIKNGWNLYYWKPWKAYLAGKETMKKY